MSRLDGMRDMHNWAHDEAHFSWSFRPDGDEGCAVCVITMLPDTCRFVAVSRVEEDVDEELCDIVLGEDYPSWDAAMQALEQDELTRFGG